MIPTLILLLVDAEPPAHGAGWPVGVPGFSSRLIGSPVRVAGAERLPDTPCVVVANHASYLDGIILTAALPAEFTYLIKYELASFPLGGFLLKRIGSEFVNREDSKHRLRTARLAAEVRHERRIPGVLPRGDLRPQPRLETVPAGCLQRRVAGKVAGRTDHHQAVPAAHVAGEVCGCAPRGELSIRISASLFESDALDVGR